MAYKLVEGLQGAKGFAAEGGWKSAQEMADEVGLDLNDLDGLYFECGELPKTWASDKALSGPATSRLRHTRVPLVVTCHRSYSVVVAKATQVVDKGVVYVTLVSDDEYLKVAC